MAQYTILNEKDIAGIAKQYAFSNVKSYKILEGGSENSNYLLSTEKGKFVCSICEQKTPQGAKDLACLLEHLASNNFPTSKILRNINNEVITLWNDKPLMVKAFIEGEIIEDIPKHLLVFIGKELGKLHKIKAPKYLPKAISYGLENFDQVRGYAPNSSFSHWLNEVKIAVQKKISSDLPKALIHGDLFFSNVIISPDNKSATMMDFEEVGYYYRVFDIGMAIVGLCSANEKTDLEKVKYLLKGYQQENELLAIELNCLKEFTIYAAAAIAFWRHQHFNHIQPDAAMFDHYLMMKNIADYVRGLPENCFG